VYDSEARLVRIRPCTGWSSLGLGQLWQFRELLFFFVWRDIKVRYKQTFLGAAWAILQPLFTMLIFSLFFGRLARMPSDGIPYPLFVFAALVPWTFFANGLTMGSTSVVESQAVLKKVYFPRLLIPVASVSAGVVDFLLSFLVLLGFMVYFGVTPTVNIMWLPFLFLLAYCTAMGVVFWFSALNVQFRDVRYTIPFIAQLWLFASPVAYPSSLLDERWQLIYSINPMVGVVEGFRWALLGTDTAPGGMITVSTILAVLIFVSGAYFFRRLERGFADVI